MRIIHRIDSEKEASAARLSLSPVENSVPVEGDVEFSWPCVNVIELLRRRDGIEADILRGSVASVDPDGSTYDRRLRESNLEGDGPADRGFIIFVEPIDDLNAIDDASARWLGGYCRNCHYKSENEEK